MGSFSIWHWLIVLVIVALVFGTKKLRGAGKDLGEAVRSFKEGVNGVPPVPDNVPEIAKAPGPVPMPKTPHDIKDVS